MLCCVKIMGRGSAVGVSLVFKGVSWLSDTCGNVNVCSFDLDSDSPLPHHPKLGMHDGYINNRE